MRLILEPLNKKPIGIILNFDDMAEPNKYIGKSIDMLIIEEDLAPFWKFSPSNKSKLCLLQIAIVPMMSKNCITLISRKP
jgi:hypothetical protein